MGPQNPWLVVKTTKRDSPLQETAETEAPCQSKHNIEPLISFVSFRVFFSIFFLHAVPGFCPAPLLFDG